MNSTRFEQLSSRYPQLQIALAGDFCLDRYLEIDPALAETSIETGLPVHNVTRVRSQPGGAGTILNNLVALGAGRIWPVGFAGQDGEGFELARALRGMRGVEMDHFVQTPLRRTFTYCKPLVMTPGQPPVELSRLDSKNWTPTPEAVEQQLIESVAALAGRVDVLILLDQVDHAGTGVITPALLEQVRRSASARLELLVLADSRRGLGGFPPVMFKMNAAELAALDGSPGRPGLEEARARAAALARRNGRPVFVTLAEQGMVAAAPDGRTAHRPALPLRGAIDIVGAGDSVTANLAAALGAGADLEEALELATAAASVVIHQLGDTGAATVAQLRERLENAAPAGLH